MKPIDKDVYEGGEAYTSDKRPVHICKTHDRRNLLNHEGYIDNKDGTVSCMYCPFGAKLDGFLKVIDGKLVDLRNYRAS